MLRIGEANLLEHNLVCSLFGWEKSPSPIFAILESAVVGNQCVLSLYIYLLLVYLKSYCFTHLLFSQLSETHSSCLPLQTRFLLPLIVIVVLFSFLQVVHLFLVSYFSQQQDVVDSCLVCDHWIVGSFLAEMQLWK